MSWQLNHVIVSLDKSASLALGNAGVAKVWKLTVQKTARAEKRYIKSFILELIFKK